MLVNALTVDVEDWYHTHDLNIDEERWDNLEDRIERSTVSLLDMFSCRGVRATFFILGCVARKHPRLVREITAAGHEIGSHGERHRMVCTQTREEFRGDLLASKSILEDITGKEIKMYRAASWSISPDTLWALQVLEEEGFVCDSSVQPFKTPLSGISGAPAVPYHPVIGGRRLNILEFPPSVLQLGKFRLPFAGGLYLRVLPRWAVVSALARVNKTSPGMVYVHPWEMDAGQPRLRVGPVVKLTHYYNLGKTGEVLEELLKHFDFVPLGDFINKGGYPAIPVLNK